MRRISVLVAFFGFVIMIGTAGNADMEIMNFPEVLKNLAVGMSMFVLGIVANEYLKKHRVSFYNRKVSRILTMLERKIKRGRHTKVNVKNNTKMTFQTVR